MAPVMPPSSWATRYGANLEKLPARAANPSVTAGFRCAALDPQAIAVNTPAMTANAQPAVITIQPLPSALVPLSSAPATTPLPSKMSTIVPRNSPSSGDVIAVLMDCARAGIDAVRVGPSRNVLASECGRADDR